MLPYPSPPNQPPATTLLVTVASLLGIGLSVFFLGSNGSAGGSGSAGLGVGLLAISGTTALASIAVYLIQRRTAAKDAAQLLSIYTQEMDRLEGRLPGDKPIPIPATASDPGAGLIQFAVAEIEARRANDPALTLPDRTDPARLPFVHQVRQRPGLMWQRRPSDPDFLHVRVGIGSVKPRFEVRLADQANTLALPAKNAAFRQAHERARGLVRYYQTLDDVPITLPLREHASVVMLTSAGEGGAARALVAQIALHHSPRDAHLFVLPPAESAADWRWALGLAPTAALPTLAWGKPQERDAALALIHGELLRRDQLLQDRTYDRQRESFLPHLLLIVDAMSPAGGELLAAPAIELALRRGKELGATVVSIHADFDQAPSRATLALDCIGGALVPLWPDPPAPIPLQTLDTLSVQDCQQVTQLTSRFAPEEQAEERLPTEVSLYELFSPAVTPPDSYPIEQVWERGRKEVTVARSQQRVSSCSIGIGRTSGGQPLELDFVKDGPHGLLIGQTGSGKSELLRSIIAGLAIKYPPDQVNFVLVDYKGGLGLDVFDRLPHTLALLTNMAQAGQTIRFLTMLEAEMLDRQEKRKRGVNFPRLFVIIDEFAEMVAHRGPSDASDVILESLLRILRLGRALDVHLLFASQRPEGSVMQKLHGYVQYRLSLRTNTEEDSREVIGRPDAARLPVEFPGRGYLLRGDYDLQLFQAARAALLFRPPDLDSGKPPVTADEEIAERMSKLPSTYQVKRWPKSLPAPIPANPTPLILVIRGAAKAVEDAWNAVPRPDFSRTPMVAPLGLIDRPAQQRRDWFLADLHGYESRLKGGPLLVMGDLNSGKTTALQTLLLYFALHFGPSQLRWYVLDPTAAFTSFAALPQARDYLEHQQSNVIDGLDEDQFKAFKARFERAMQEPVSPAGGSHRPPLLLVIDDYDELSAQYRDKTQLHKLAEQVIRNRERQVYLAIAASKQSYDNFPQQILNGMATRIALYMSNRDNLGAVLGGRAPFVPDPLPGRGFAQTRTSLDEIQIAAPVYGLNDAERLEGLQIVLDTRSGG